MITRIYSLSLLLLALLSCPLQAKSSLKQPTKAEPPHSLQNITTIGDGAFHQVIPALTGQPVLPMANPDDPIWHRIAQEILADIQSHPIRESRINEVGNQAETFVMQALSNAGFAVSRPPTQSGRTQLSGYPDLRAAYADQIYYIEVKVYSPGTEDSSYRTFYLSASDDPKVTEPACHLLLALCMDEVADGTYQALSARWLDLYHLPLGLKLEYNASNRDLYHHQPDLIFQETLAPAESPQIQDAEPLHAP